MVRTFYGKRLQIAREFRGFTQAALAHDVSASCSLVSLCETGKKNDPARDLVEALGAALGFHPDFFFEPLEDRVVEEDCSFRHRRAAPERLKAQVRAHGTLITLVIAKLQSVFKFPPVDVPLIRASCNEEAEVAAEQCREHWDLGLDTPILQIGRVLERAGVVIVRHLVSSSKVDAFSRYGRTPLIFLNQAIASTSRWNFDIGHECGHLVMHRGRRTGDVESEAAADRFAGALLMPRNAFSREFSTAPFSWRHVFDLKRRWQASAAAIVRRAYDLRILEAIQYRRAFKYMSANGWTKGEPYEPYFQQPELLDMALSGLGTKVQLSIYELCEELGFTFETFKAVTGTEVPRQRNKLTAVIPFVLTD